MLRTARRTIIGALGTLTIAVLVAMVASQFVRALRWLVAWPSDGDQWWSIVVVAGATLSIIVVHRAHTRGDTTEAFARALDEPPLDIRPAPARLAATAAGVGLGTPLGADGPALYLGGALAARCARVLRRDERSWTIAAGVAALSMVVAAPIAAAAFAVEVEPRRLPRRRDVWPLVAGAAAGWAIRRLTGDPGGVLGPASAQPLRSVAPAALVIGVVCGLIGGWFALAMAGARSHRRPVRHRIAIAVAALGLAVPLGWATTGRAIFVGPDDRLLDWARSTSAMPTALAAVALAALLLALAHADVVGGLLVPMLSLGALVGLVLARTWLPGAPTTFVVVAGGCALLATAHRAPATAVAIGFSLLGWSAAGWASAVAVGVAMGAAGRRG